MSAPAPRRAALLGAAFLFLTGPAAPAVAWRAESPAPSPLALGGLAPDPLPAPRAPRAPGIAPEVLRSLAVPGWGAWHAGHREVGLAFLAAEVGLASAAAVSIGQGHLRRGSSEQTALLFADIDLTAREDRFRRLVSDYRSSEEYNRLVVYREAAALHYGDFESYNRYIEEHSLRGEEYWAWQSDADWERYRRQRRTSESAFKRARFAVAGMVVNRVAAAVTAGYLVSRGQNGRAAAAALGDGVAAGGLEWTVQPTAGRGWEHRLAWVLRF